MGSKRLVRNGRACQQSSVQALDDALQPQLRVFIPLSLGRNTCRKAPVQLSSEATQGILDLGREEAELRLALPPLSLQGIFQGACPHLE